MPTDHTPFMTTRAPTVLKTNMSWKKCFVSLYCSSKKIFDELAAIQILIAEDLSTNTCKTMKSTFVFSFGDNI